MMKNPVATLTGLAIIVFALVMLLPILKELLVELRGGPKQRTYGSFSAGRPRKEQVGAHDHMGVRLQEGPDRVNIPQQGSSESKHDAPSEKK